MSFDDYWRHFAPHDPEEVVHPPCKVHEAIVNGTQTSECRICKRRLIFVNFVWIVSEKG